ncbi:LOX5 lipoxygenase, partial [Polypterus senegalus]
MVTYKLTVATGIDEDAGTFDYVYGTVIGELGQSQQTALDTAGRDRYNGCMIKSCFNLPEIFPVTEDMVQATLGPNTTLNKEMKIQQNPGQDNPIFLPSDPELDWLLAKMWVRHAEFQVYEALSHLLRTHLVSEVCCIATMRQLPTVHPVYKDRNVSRLKNYFYRDDSLKQWEAIKSFVSSIVDLYYSSDMDVMEDKELQNWIHDVVTEGFRDLHKFGLSSEIKDKTELVTILAGVIFTGSAQHAAINNGQFDWCSWVPNTPCSMRCPPPTRKGLATMDLIMNTLPDVHMSCFEVAITLALSRELPTAVWLGQYPEDYFIEKAAKDHIEKFREALKKIEKSIDERNENRQLKYEYLSPRKIENSIAI